MYHLPFTIYNLQFAARPDAESNSAPMDEGKMKEGKMDEGKMDEGKMNEGYNLIKI